MLGIGIKAKQDASQNFDFYIFFNSNTKTGGKETSPHPTRFKIGFSDEVLLIHLMKLAPINTSTRFTRIWGCPSRSGTKNNFLMRINYLSTTITFPCYTIVTLKLHKLDQIGANRSESLNVERSQKKRLKPLYVLGLQRF